MGVQELQWKQILQTPLHHTIEILGNQEKCKLCHKEMKKTKYVCFCNYRDENLAEDCHGLGWDKVNFLSRGSCGALFWIF